MTHAFKNDLHLLFDQILLKTRYVLQHFNDYISFCKKEKIEQSERAIAFIYNQIKQTIAYLKEIRKALSLAYKLKQLVKIESDLRVALQAISTAHLYLSWRSPSASQAVIPHFFNLADQGSKRVLYERWGHNEVQRIENQLAKIFTLPTEQFACTVVNSGMASLSLAEQFLSANVLNPGDAIIVTSSTYFEFKEKLKLLKWLRVIESNSYCYKQLIETIEQNNAKAIFMDVLANTSEQRMIDIQALLEYFKNHRCSPMFVIDGTMLPCAAVPYITSFTPQDNIFYIESCSKYLQLGLDMSIAGVLVHSARYKPQLEMLRRLNGSILTERDAHLFPVYTKEQLMNKLARIEKNAFEIADALATDAAITRLYSIVYPRLDNHNDNLLAKTINRAGGCIVFRLLKQIENKYDMMKQLVKIIIANAQQHKLPIAEGLSFGFSFARMTADVPREGASAAVIDNSGVVRLYVGDQSNLNKKMINLLKTSMTQHAERYL